MNINNLERDLLDLLIADQYDELIRVCETTIHDQPELLSFYAYLGVAYLLHGDEETCEELWLSCLLEYDNDLIKFQNQLIFDLEKIFLALFDNDKFYQAKQIFNIIHKLDDNYKNTDIANHVAVKLNKLCLQGINYAESNQFERAKNIFKKILVVAEQDVQTWLNLALLYINNLHWEQAREALFKTIEISPKNPLYHKLIGGVFEQLNQPKLAIKAYRTANKLGFAEKKEIYIPLAICYDKIGKFKTAIRIATIGSRLYPDNLTLLRLKQGIFPIVYSSISELRFYRKRYSTLLFTYLKDSLKLLSQKPEEVLDSHFFMITNYFLSYQGLNDKKLLENYGIVSTKVAQKNLGRLCVLQTTPKKINRKIRIGYISQRLSSGLQMLSIGWVKYADRSQFEIFAYDLTDPKKKASSEYDFSRYVDSYYRLEHDPKNVISKIINDNLDILVFNDIGMDKFNYLLASLRLAPIQCTTWNHPVTSGLPTIDYFLTSQLMEPDNYQHHYSEKVVLLPNLGSCISQPKVEFSGLSRNDIISDPVISSKTLYFCCQSRQKYLPQHDYIFPEIALKNPDSYFLFITSGEYHLDCDKIFCKRLISCFEEYGLNYNDYCDFLPRYPHNEFVEVLSLMDIFLDTFSWSGGITTIHALTVNLPVVTLPGKLMRSRHSYAMLKMIELDELIAINEQDYIDIAARLGNDTDWRLSIKQKINQNLSMLFDDQECVRALESFYLSVVQ